MRDPGASGDQKNAEYTPVMPNNCIQSPKPSTLCSNGERGSTVFQMKYWAAAEAVRMFESGPRYQRTLSKAYAEPTYIRMHRTAQCWRNDHSPNPESENLN